MYLFFDLLPQYIHTVLLSHNFQMVTEEDPADVTGTDHLPQITDVSKSPHPPPMCVGGGVGGQWSRFSTVILYLHPSDHK